MFLRAILLVAMISGSALPAVAQYSWQQAFPNLPAFNNPVELVNAGDGSNRLFVVQQRGIIYVFRNMPGIATRNVFLNISDKVSSSGSETGLLGLAFHPNYPANGYFYVYYTSSSSGSLVSYLARYSVSAGNRDSADKSSEQILFTVSQPFSNHNGGKIAFGPDGFLYIGLGDGGSANDPGNRAQNRADVLGKVLRIDVDRTDPGLSYAIPPSNPYATNTQGWRKEIYAYGIRNPWKFSFDSQTGWLWLGDVGQNAREEVDIIVSGGNYGWRLMEGSLCTPGVNPSCLDTAGTILPVWEYPNAGSDIAITGGYVYRGAAIPSLVGKYICGDYGSGKTWAVTYNVGTPSTGQLMTDETYPISTFGVDEQNELYLCSYSSTNGRIYKITGPATSVEETRVPMEFGLDQNYPNPFNPSTTISFRLAAGGDVTLKVYNMLGQEVALLVNGTYAAGLHSVKFSADGYPSGVYYYKLTSGSLTQTRKMILTK